MKEIVADNESYYLHLAEQKLGYTEVSQNMSEMGYRYKKMKQE